MIPEIPYKTFSTSTGVLQQTILESDDISCADGIDNDNDLLIDCDDPKCQHLVHCTKNLTKKHTNGFIISIIIISTIVLLGFIFFMYQRTILTTRRRRLLLKKSKISTKRKRKFHKATTKIKK